MATETDIALIEIQQAKKILQNESHTNERIIRTITESERLLKSKDLQIAEMKKQFEFLVSAYDCGAVLIPHSVFDEIKQLLK